VRGDGLLLREKGGGPDVDCRVPPCVFSKIEDSEVREQIGTALYIYICMYTRIYIHIYAHTYTQISNNKVEDGEVD